MEYFNGIVGVNVSDIDCLNDMSQDMANSIATGPQDNFFTSLDSFNQELTYHGIEAIDVTNKWNWKPGTSKKIIEYQMQRLQLKKTHGGITKQLDRTRDRANYMTYIRNQASRLEELKYELKQAGVTKDVDIPAFQQQATDLVRIIIDQCSLVKDLTEGKVIMNPYMSTDFSSRNTPFYLDVKLTGLTLSIYNGDKEIQEIPLDDIHLVFSYSFRHYINNFLTGWRTLGCYGDLELQNTYRFPYIAAPTRARGNYNGELQYGTVCLDRFNQDIKKAFLSKDYIQMSMHLMNWAQYYSTTHSNPYNNLSLLHLGIPNSYSSEYRAVISHVEDSCSTRIRTTYPWIEGNDVLEYSKQIISPCMEIECQLMESCNQFKRHANRVLDIDDLSDRYCQIESLIGITLDGLFSNDEWTRSDWNQVLENCGLGYYDFRHITRNSNFETSEEKNNAWLDCLIPELIGYWLDGNIDDFFALVMYYDASSRSTSTSYFDWGYPVEELEEITVDEDITGCDDDIKRAMLEWATNPERSR